MADPFEIGQLILHPETGNYGRVLEREEERPGFWRYYIDWEYSWVSDCDVEFVQEFDTEEDP